ncbi:diguanylate cyclase (GGDEF)-like protein [Kineococcus xinjiangensis]|uniref:Diguanylate cyclase (GGDEF)-like protein n=1 Tax=Kineococcus xinjiangensis TaxID=512762 RepID=A0A2S6IHS1_9ACTN|nr:EAL domain-containing protein [Kineococcus xinjiangensis]PPK93764.1 diguanylate cyclase (GGDEF)-like protein [Kineococcus xinjiangensis]
MRTTLSRAVSSAQSAADAHPRRMVLLLLTGCTALVVLPLVPATQALTPLLVLLAAVFALGGLVGGIQLHRPRVRGGWQRIALAMVLFLAGILIRPWSLAQDGPVHYLGDVFSLSGYAALICGLAKLARAHGGLRREVLCDGLVLTVAGALAALSHLVVPTAAISGRPALTSVLAGIYPLVDVVVLALVLDLLLSARPRTSHRLLGAAMGAMFVGDLAYAIMGTTGRLVGPPVIDAPFAVGFVLVGAAGLHPSLADRQLPGPRTDGSPVQAWSPRRLTLLCVSLAGLIAAVSVPGPDAELHRAAATLALALVFGLLLVRGVSAVNGHARARAVLLRRATHDALTDLPDRAEVQRLLDAQPVGAEQAPLWVAFLDLDGFKRVNDAFGHHSGDELIRRTAERLRPLAPAGAVLGRLAGDEFVLGLRGGEEEVRDLAEKLLAAVSAPVQLPVAEVVVSASAGIAPVVEGAVAALRDADAAMQRAKAAGRNRVAVFDESMRRDTAEDVELERDLRQAVGELALEVAYQPIVDIGTQRPAGVEALLRWTRPGCGPVSPVRFVPLLEDTGLITVVGLQVLREAVEQLARWRAEGVVGTSFVMSVNVSPQQLLDRAFPMAVGHILRDARVEGSALLLEITESSMLHEDEGTLQVLHDLRSLGVGLAVDDFGTGYSALSYLRRFPVTRVKVDRSFIRGLCSDPSDEALVRAAEAMSRALSLAMTAEGVETEEQRLALQAMGVRHGQGWLWGKAEPALVCAAVLRSAGRDGSWGVVETTA